jgi:predicted secreted protein
MPVVRTKCISTRVTDEEYARLEALAGETSLSACVRAAVVKAATPPAESILLAEILALRVILLNLDYATNQGERYTRETMRALIDRADQEKHQHALECLAPARPARVS